MKLFLFLALGASATLFAAQYLWSIGLFQKETVKVALDATCPEGFAADEAVEALAAQRLESGRASGQSTEQIGTTENGAVLIVETRKICREL